MSTGRYRIDRGRLAALLRKEFAQIGRDPSTFLIALALPLLLLFMFGYGISLDTSRTRIGVVLEDSGASALGLAQSYARSPYFDVTMARSVPPVRAQMVASTLRGMVVIPADFSETATTCIGTPIAVGATCTATITFNPGPGDQGSLSGRILVQSDAANSPIGINLVGVGAALAAEAIEIEAQHSVFAKQFPRRGVQGKASWLGFFEKTFAGQVPQKPLQSVGIRAAGEGKRLNFRMSGGDMIGHAQSCRDVDAPWSTEIGQVPKAHPAIMPQSGRHAEAV